ncbi:MAG: hypothetical protein P8N07_00780 [Flavobacteriales bacterium]|nr:hypothetical protein [Flavobacteriales bacterium]
MEKLCLECQDPVKGRADKKFCSDYCRNSYNNKLDVGDKNLIRNINNRLKKNYKILCELNKGEKSKTHRDKLITMNFDFKYFTSIYTTKKGTVYYFVYNQGYLELENGFYMLVKQYD